MPRFDADKGLQGGSPLAAAAAAGAAAAAAVCVLNRLTFHLSTQDSGHKGAARDFDPYRLQASPPYLAAAQE